MNERMDCLQAQPKGEFVHALLVWTGETPKVTQSCQGVARQLPEENQNVSNPSCPATQREKDVCVDTASKSPFWPLQGLKHCWFIPVAFSAPIAHYSMQPVAIIYSIVSLSPNMPGEDGQVVPGLFMFVPLSPVPGTY